MDFAKDQGIMDPLQLQQIASQVQQGDLSTIMKSFEDDIRQPLRNVFVGNLIRSLFIQIQKAKVDSELAISALDKLLKSNELNFAFLAVVPAFVAVHSSLSFIRHWIASISGSVQIHVRTKLVKSLRDIERLAMQHASNDCESPNNNPQLILLGLFLLETQYLRNLAKKVSENDRFMLMQDIYDLENANLSMEDKRRVITRIWKSMDILK